MKRMKFTKADYYLRLAIYVGFIIVAYVCGHATEKCSVFAGICLAIIGIAIFKWVEEALNSFKKPKIKKIEEINIDIPIE